MKTSNFTKVLRVGRLPQDGDLFCKIEFKAGKLSITGVEGPRSNGDARGGCGQIEMHYAHRNPEHNDNRTTNPTQPGEIEFAPGWDAEKWLDLLEVWHVWHLNDMRPGCEHQTGPAWTSKPVKIYHFRLTDEASKLKAAARAAAISSLETGATFTPTPEQQFVGTLEWGFKHHSPNPPGKLGLYYQPKTPIYVGDTGSEETKQTGWLNQSEHPEGFLSKPCPVCGYKYGSQWRKVEVPAKVIKFLQSLPDADTQPAWV